MPKSSIAIRTPRSLIAASRRAVCSTSRIRVVSVISIVSASGESPESAERVADVVDQLVAVELAARDVDGHRDLVPGGRPLGALPAALGEHPAPDLGDQAGLLEQRDEAVGLHDPALGVAASGSAPRLRSGACRRGRASAGRRGRTARGRAPRAGPSPAPCAPGRRPACRSRTSRSGCARPTSRGTSRCRRRAAGCRRSPGRPPRSRCSRRS